MHIIGLLGAKGAGKDTAAQYLLAQRCYTRLAFADKLYREAADAFGTTVPRLGHRDTKETPQPECALRQCQDAAFVRCVADELGVAALTDAFLDEPRSPRFILQLWGTEYRRRRGNDSYWLDVVQATIAQSPGTRFVLTDVRFANEAQLVSNLGGRLVRVRRPALEAADALDRAASGTSAHASETEMLRYPVDAELVNLEGQPGALAWQLDALFADWRQGTLGSS